MNDSAIMIATLALICLMMALIAMLRLQRRMRALEQRCHTLESQVQRGNHDLIGLCSAALAIDRRLSGHDTRLQGLQNTVSNVHMDVTPSFEAEVDEAFEQEEEPILEGYDKAIFLIRRGTDVETLVKSCGVTHDEAMLLMRLHGGR